MRWTKAKPARRISGPAPQGAGRFFGHFVPPQLGRHARPVDIGPFSDETMMLELLLEIRDNTSRILGILEEDDEEEDSEEDP